MNLTGAIAKGARPSGRFSVRLPDRSMSSAALPEGGRNLAGGKAPATPPVPAPPVSCTPAGCWKAAHQAGVPRPLRGRRTLGAFPGVSSPALLNPRLSSPLPPGELHSATHRSRPSPARPASSPAHEPRGAAVPAAGSRGVSPRVLCQWGGTPRQPAGGDACATLTTEVPAFPGVIRHCQLSSRRHGRLPPDLPGGSSARGLASPDVWDGCPVGGLALSDIQRCSAASGICLLRLSVQWSGTEADVDGDVAEGGLAFPPSPDRGPDRVLLDPPGGLRAGEDWRHR